MTLWLVVATGVHMASIAFLFPSLASELSDTHHLWVFATLFPLGALSALVHSHLREQENSKADFASFVVGMGITYFGMFLLSRFSISFGAADPFAAREQAGSLERIGWYVGFSFILLIGNTMLVARPILALSDALLRPLRRASIPTQFGLLLILSSAMGFAATRMVASQQASELAAKFNTQLSENPGPIVIAAIAIPAVLGMLARTLFMGRKR